MYRKVISIITKQELPNLLHIPKRLSNLKVISGNKHLYFVLLLWECSNNYRFLKTSPNPLTSIVITQFDCTSIFVHTKEWRATCNSLHLAITAFMEQNPMFNSLHE